MKRQLLILPLFLLSFGLFYSYELIAGCTNCGGQNYGWSSNVVVHHGSSSGCVGCGSSSTVSYPSQSHETYHSSPSYSGGVVISSSPSNSVSLVSSPSSSSSFSGSSGSSFKYGKGDNVLIGPSQMGFDGKSRPTFDIRIPGSSDKGVFAEVVFNDACEPGVVDRNAKKDEGKKEVAKDSKASVESEVPDPTNTKDAKTETSETKEEGSKDVAKNDSKDETEEPQKIESGDAEGETRAAAPPRNTEAPDSKSSDEADETSSDLSDIAKDSETNSEPTKADLEKEEAKKKEFAEGTRALDLENEMEKKSIEHLEATLKDLRNGKKLDQYFSEKEAACVQKFLDSRAEERMQAQKEEEQQQKQELAKKQEEAKKKKEAERLAGLQERGNAFKEEVGKRQAAIGEIDSKIKKETSALESNTSSIASLDGDAQDAYQEVLSNADSYEGDSKALETQLSAYLDGRRKSENVEGNGQNMMAIELAAQDAVSKRRVSELTAQKEEAQSKLNEFVVETFEKETIDFAKTSSQKEKEGFVNGMVNLIGENIQNPEKIAASMTDEGGLISDSSNQVVLGKWNLKEIEENFLPEGERLDESARKELLKKYYDEEWKFTKESALEVAKKLDEKALEKKDSRFSALAEDFRSFVADDGYAERVFEGVKNKVDNYDENYYMASDEPLCITCGDIDEDLEIPLKYSQGKQYTDKGQIVEDDDGNPNRFSFKKYNGFLLEGGEYLEPEKGKEPEFNGKFVSLPNQKTALVSFDQNGNPLARYNRDTPLVKAPELQASLGSYYQERKEAMGEESWNKFYNTLSPIQKKGIDKSIGFDPKKETQSGSATLVKNLNDNKNVYQPSKPSSNLALNSNGNRKPASGNSGHGTQTSGQIGSGSNSRNNVIEIGYCQFCLGASAEYNRKYSNYVLKLKQRYPNANIQYRDTGDKGKISVRSGSYYSGTQSINSAMSLLNLPL